MDTSIYWGAFDCPSKIIFVDLIRFRTEYRIPDSVVPDPDERACCPQSRCTALSEAILKVGFRLPIYPYVIWFSPHTSQPELMEPDGGVVDVVEGGFLRGGDVLLHFSDPIHT